jgi:hypothetical protein
VDRRFKVAPTQHADYNERTNERKKKKKRKVREKEERKKDEEKIVKERNRSPCNYYQELRQVLKAIVT